MDDARSKLALARKIPRWQALAIVPLAVPGLLALPVVSSGADPKPVEPIVNSVALDDLLMVMPVPSTKTENEVVDDATTPEQRTKSDDGRTIEDGSHTLATHPIETEPFSVAGVTWAADGDASHLEVEVRTRSDGTWSSWSVLHDDDHGPDPGSAEAENARSGTEPLVVEDADAVQVRLDADGERIPKDLEIELIDPGESTADSSVGTPNASAASAAATRPAIYTRAQWGADESLREPGDPDYGQVLGAFVHHTAGTNTYSSSQVPAIIRGIYAYHVNGRGWRDIGYNFLVDRFGRIWEGRFGGVDKAVVGAHTAGYNSNAFAMSALGTYTTKAPETTLVGAYQRLFAWKFTLHGVVPSVAVKYPGGATLQPVAGHRDTKATECPGARLYARLDDIRAGATMLMDDIPATKPSAIRLAAPPSAPARTTVTLKVYWSAGTWVTGIANLQRWHIDAWQYVGQVHVFNGRASVNVFLDRTRTYRIYGRYAPGVQLKTSANLTVIAS